MAPIAIIDKELEAAQVNNIADLKAKVVVDHVEREVTPPPVADDFMYDFQFNHSLPTYGHGAVEIPEDCDAQVEAESIIHNLSLAMGSGDAQAFTALFLEFG